MVNICSIKKVTVVHGSISRRGTIATLRHTHNHIANLVLISLISSDKSAKPLWCLISRKHKINVRGSSHETSLDTEDIYVSILSNVTQTLKPFSRMNEPASV